MRTERKASRSSSNDTSSHEYGWPLELLNKGKKDVWIKTFTEDQSYFVLEMGLSGHNFSSKRKYWLVSAGLLHCRCLKWRPLQGTDQGCLM